MIGYSDLYGKDNLVLFSPYIVVLFLFLVMYSAIDVFNIKMIIFNNDFTLDHVSDKTLSNMDTNWTISNIQYAYVYIVHFWEMY